MGSCSFAPFPQLLDPEWEISLRKDLKGEERVNETGSQSQERGCLLNSGFTQNGHIRQTILFIALIRKGIPGEKGERG